jgi:hypothetical protein
MTKPASITNLVLASSSYLINQNTNLSFNFKVNNIIPVGAIFEIIVPTEFATNTPVKLNNVIQSYTLPGTSVSFTLSNMVNPVNNIFKF